VRLAIADRDSAATARPQARTTLRSRVRAVSAAPQGRAIFRRADRNQGRRKAAAGIGSAPPAEAVRVPEVPVTAGRTIAALRMEAGRSSKFRLLSCSPVVDIAHRVPMRRGIRLPVIRRRVIPRPLTPRRTIRLRRRRPIPPLLAVAGMRRVAEADTRRAVAEAIAGDTSLVRALLLRVPSLRARSSRQNLGPGSFFVWSPRGADASSVCDTPRSPGIRKLPLSLPGCTHHGHKIQIAVKLVIIQPKPHHEPVRNLEAAKIHRDLHNAPRRTIEESTDRQ
jgi:hypothetical protein